MAPESKLDLGAVERRRRQMAAERLYLEHRKGMPGYPHHVVEALGQPLDGRERIDPLDAGGLRHACIVGEIAERMSEVVGRTVAAVRHHEVLEIGQRQLPL